MRSILGLKRLAPKPETCLDCGANLDLQDRARDVWWCAACRSFSDGAGRLLLPSAIPRQICAEEFEARKLVEDLLAVGCGIHFDDEGLRITVLTKIPTALWRRLEEADAEFLRAAREMAEALADAGAGQWVN